VKKRCRNMMAEAGGLVKRLVSNLGESCWWLGGDSSRSGKILGIFLR
jgi:hypothetical protein